jgi:hypothetical protein
VLSFSFELNDVVNREDCMASVVDECVMCTRTLALLGMMLTKKTDILEGKSCPVANLSTINPKWTAVG